MSYNPTAETAFTVPTTDGSVLLKPTDVTTDHETLEISATVPSDVHDQLSEYERSGNVTIEETAFGAFRRISRDGSDPITVDPPGMMAPPFESRSVFVTDYSADEIAAGRYSVSITFGLEEPRGRSPPDATGDGEVVDSQTVTVGARETQTITLEWQTEASDDGQRDLITRTTNTHGVESTDATSVSVADQLFALSFASAPIQLTRNNVHTISRGTSSGVPSLVFDVDLTASRAAVLLAVGSRANASTVREVPDGQNVPVDTLPDTELTADLIAPDDHEITAGQYILSSWSIVRSSPIGAPYRATLELLLDETKDYGTDLVVASGDTYSVPTGEIHSYETATIDGTAEVDGVLEVQ